MSELLNVSKSIELYTRACELIPAGSQTNSKRPSGYAPGAYPVYFASAKGCRITDIDGKPITKEGEVVTALRGKRAGDVIAVTVDRDGQQLTLQVTLVERPSAAR